MCFMQALGFITVPPISKVGGLDLLCGLLARFENGAPDGKWSESAHSFWTQPCHGRVTRNVRH